MPCAVILTALPVEYMAVRTHLLDLQEETHPQGTVYERGKFVTNGNFWEVGIVEVGAGNAGAGIEAERAIAYFKPEILFFVGIAGGIKDVAICDVVAATKVYGYESGKVGDQFLTRPEVGQSAYALVRRAKREAEKTDWLQRLSSSPVPQPRVFVAPIAAGEKVIASKQSDIFQLLRISYNDAIAVEMEGFGFLSAAFAYPNIKAIVIRGISDLIEGKNDDSVESEQVRQEKASLHASAFAFEILSKTLVTETGSNQQLIENLQLKFQQLENGWLSNRYSPDLHQTGQIEADLQLRLNSPSSQPIWLHEVRQIRVLLEDVHLAILRLRRYPQFMQRDDAENLISSAEKWIIAAIAEQQELENRIVSGNSFPLPDFEREVTDEDAPWQLIRVIEPDEKHSLESPTADIGRQLEATLNRWCARKVTPRYLQNLGKPAAYIGEPGVGKTHALAHAVRRQLKAGQPAVLIRAKDLNLAQSWDVILAEAIGMSGSNINQVLDALEAAAILVENSRVLIAIDGLDETPRAERWAEKVGELIPLAKKYPKVLFVCSLRTNLFDRIALPGGINSVYLSASDATIGEIFKSYCKVNRIECPPILRWALQTPLAIRLFADLYKEKHIDINAVTLQDFSLAKLIDRKINHAERAIRENDPEGWSENITPVRDTLLAIVKACLSKGKLLQTQALKVAETAQKIPGILSCKQLLNLLEKCGDRGLLLLRSQPSDDPFEGDLLFWEPAYETITDFLLAWEAHKEAKTNNPEMPDYLMYRGNAITLAAYLLGMDGYDFFTTGLWSNNLSIKKREELRLTTILMMSLDKGEIYRTWVIEIFKRNMPSCRKVLDRLVIPGLRIPGFLYGAKFVHDVLLPMQVAERDLFWSGPDYIPHNHGAPWEGFGEPVLDESEIADDDTWDAAPLLLAWATTTVKNDSRRRIRGKIAVWGSQNPDGLLALLKEACQTNDPQMQEDILSAAYGASCLTRPDEKWLHSCAWLIDNFFVPKAPLYTHNIVVRHSARSIIERCVACHVAIDAERLISVHTPYMDPEEILCIDKDAAIHVDPHLGIEPVTGDLAWYVVPRVIKRFFERYQLMSTNRTQREYSPSAQVFLSKYSAEYEISDLSPTQFAFGFVVAYITELGWSRENFIKEPNGGEPGEILGADIAILREYSQASHGSRSTTGTFCEKYVWASTHELSGFLADRIAVYDWNKCFEPPVDLSLLAEATNPASDVGYGQLKLNQVLDFSELVPDTELTEFAQVDRVNEWIQKAPLPNISSLLLHNLDELPEWARNDEWIVLRSFVIRRNADSQAESALRASSFLFPSNASPLLEEDAQLGILTELNEFSSGVSSVEFYRDPCEVVWAPWIEEIEGAIGHKTLDAIGNPIELQLQATTCQFHWEAPDGENNEWVPAKAIREMLGIVDFREGQFLTASGQVQAFTFNNPGERWHTPSCQVLLVRRTALFESLAQLNLSIGWGIWLNREPSYPLITISDQKRMFRNWYAIALGSGETFKVIPYKDNIEPWYKDDDIAEVTPKS